MLEPSDKRKFTRMGAECKMSYTHLGSGETGSGHSINLSAAGILFSTRKKLDPGASLDIVVKPVNTLTPPLHALIEIIRVIPMESGEFEVAAAIEGIKGT